MKRRPVVVVLHGPSGVGKDAVVDRLSEEFGLHRPTSTTSRPPRAREVDGVHYHFISREEFERKIRAGDFLEYAPVYDDWKGLEREEFTRPLVEGKDIVIRTDVQGARTWRHRLEGAVFVFLAAEDRDVLRARLLARDTESEESLARRMQELEGELADQENNDYVVINRQGALEEAVREIAAIIDHERSNPARPEVRLVDEAPIPTVDSGR